MSVIYSSASQVLMYLGSGSPETDRVMDFLNGALHSTVWTDSGTPFADIQRFLRWRYFHRVWVLQEIALAKLTTLVAGDKTARWSASSIQDLQSQISKGNIYIPSALQWHPATKLERDLLKVLQKSRNCSATDPRDKVYAVLGLVQPDIIEGLLVDYSSSPEDVYTTVAQHLIMRHGCMNVLKHGCDNDRHFPAMSSWVPQWDKKSRQDPIPAQFSVPELRMLSQDWYLPLVLQDGDRLRSFDGMLKHFVAGHELESQDTRSTAYWHQRITREAGRRHVDLAQMLGTDPHSLALYTSHKLDRTFHHQIYTREERLTSTRILRVRAHLLDTITSTSATPSTQLLLPSTQSLAESWADPKFPLEKVPVAFGSVLRCSTCSDDGDCRANFPCKSCKSTTSVRVTWSSNHARRYSSFRHREMRSSDTEKIFVTTQSVGISSVALAEADTIWAIDGTDVPMILRSISDFYVLVGPCYLHEATKSLPCGCCGKDAKPWPMVTQIIDIW
jgi:hypothetical protein